MENHSADPAAAAADLNAALDTFEASLAALPSEPVALEQQAFAAFYHS
jgi:hypothetical protein